MNTNMTNIQDSAVQGDGLHALPSKMRYKSERSASRSSLTPSSPVSNFSGNDLSRFSSPAIPWLNGSRYASTTPSSPVSSLLLHDDLAKQIHVKDVAVPKRLERMDMKGVSHDIRIRKGDIYHIGRKLTSSSLKSPLSEGTLLRLPKAAKHASRLHCTIAWQADTSSVDIANLHIDVLGSNGMVVNGRNKKQGSHFEKLPADGRALILGFHSGVEINLYRASDEHPPTPSAEDTSLSARESETSHPTSEATEQYPDLDSLFSDGIGDDDPQLDGAPEADVVQTKRVRRAASIAMSLDSSPLSVASRCEPGSPASPTNSAMHRKRSASPPYEAFSIKRQKARSSSPISAYAHQEDDGYPPESSEDEEGDMSEELEALMVDVAKLRESIKPLSLDLVGSLASTIVFQPRATLTTSECTSLFLSDQPSLLGHGSEAAWRVIVARVLSRGPFGCIGDKGLKDAAGRRIEPSWHYVPSADQDGDRRASLAPFVKAIRSTQRERKQYFYKRPSDLSKRKRW